jgi:hypothetical protein
MIFFYFLQNLPPQKICCPRRGPHGPRHKYGPVDRRVETNLLFLRNIIEERIYVPTLFSNVNF